MEFERAYVSTWVALIGVNGVLMETSSYLHGRM